MAQISISAPIQKLKIIKERCLSPSKVFQLGLELAVNQGLSTFYSQKEEIGRLKEIIELKNSQIAEYENKITSLRSDLRMLQEQSLKRDM